MRKMVKIEVVHSGGYVEHIATDDPTILGEWLIHTAHVMPNIERSLTGNWTVRPYELASERDEA